MKKTYLALALALCLAAAGCGKQEQQSGQPILPIESASEGGGATKEDTLFVSRSSAPEIFLPDELTRDFTVRAIMENTRGADARVLVEGQEGTANCILFDGEESNVQFNCLEALQRIEAVGGDGRFLPGKLFQVSFEDLDADDNNELVLSSGKAGTLVSSVLIYWNAEAGRYQMSERFDSVSPPEAKEGYILTKDKAENRVRWQFDGGQLKKEDAAV